MDKNQDILSDYIEPIYRFAFKRLINTYDAEDLAQEILLHSIKGLKKYDIRNFDSWVWKVAHNRYQVFLRRKYTPLELSDNISHFDNEVPDILDKMIDEDLKNKMFLSLHSISSMYRDILIQYYIYEKPVNQIASLYTLPVSTVKWRLHAGREKLKERIENKMNGKIYERMYWWVACNGSMDSNLYLDRQICRAICLAAYKKPYTIEEISLGTGIPTIYIEDQIEFLEYGDAIIKQGNKISTDFIILRNQDSKLLYKELTPKIQLLTSKITGVLSDKKDDIKKLGIIGINHEMSKLGYLIIPLLIRGGITKARNKLGLKTPPFPLRKDGGNGWFVVGEQNDTQKYVSGCNKYTLDNKWNEYISWFWINKYFNQKLNIFLNRIENKKLRIISQPKGFTRDALDEETVAMLLKFNLFKKRENILKPNFSIFNGDELERFESVFEKDKQDIAVILDKTVKSIYDCYKSFVPFRLHSQILGVMGSYLNSLVGFIVNELQNQDILAEIREEDPLVWNIMYVNKNI